MNYGIHFKIAVAVSRTVVNYESKTILHIGTYQNVNAYSEHGIYISFGPEIFRRESNWLTIEKNV